MKDIIIKEKRRGQRLEYKQAYQTMGVYKIQNKVNGKILLGSSTNMDGIMNSQRFQLMINSHPNAVLQREWNEYGPENFIVESLEIIKPREETLAGFDELKKYQEELANLEQRWFEKLQPFDERGYHKNLPKKLRTISGR